MSTRRDVKKVRLLLSLIMINAMLFGGSNVVRAQETLGKCGCCLHANGTSSYCCQAIECGHGDTCCTVGGNCTATNCN